MALIADPQLVDPHTYPRRGLALTATMFYSDVYLKKSFALLNDILLPESTVFLGDLLDGGREWSTESPSWSSHKPDDRTEGREDWWKFNNGYWENEFNRFNKIFPQFPGRRSIRSLPGNHDLGFANGVNVGVVDRFKVFFGDTSSVHTLGNHTFVLIDSVSLENTENPSIYGPAKKFLEEFTSMIPSPRSILQKGPQLFPSEIYDAGEGSPPVPTEEPITPLPKILLSHVPLYRPQNTPCGPLRESSSESLSLRGGFQYQNVLQPETSADILKKVQPMHVFSGDDHDYCEILHAGATGMVKEITVKSFSPNMGVRRPGFLMLSLWNPVTKGVIEGGPDTPTIQTKLCLLPDQIGIWMFYFFLFSVTKFIMTLKVVWLWYTDRKCKGRDEPLLPVSQEDVLKLKHAMPADYNNSSVCSARNSTTISSRPHTSSGPLRAHYGGYGVPSSPSPPEYGTAAAADDNDDDKYAKKPTGGGGAGLPMVGMPAALQQKIDQGLIELGNKAGSVGVRVAEKVIERVPSLAPTVERGKEILRREMKKKKGGVKGWLGRVWVVVSEWGPAVLMLFMWYAWLVFTAA